MIQLIYSPSWFYGKDIVIDVVSLFILLFVAYFALKYYLIDKKSKRLILVSSFAVMALSFLFKVITNFTIYYTNYETKNVGFATLSYNSLHQTDILFSIGMVGYRILMLLGVYLLYLNYNKQKKSDMIITTLFISMLVYFSKSQYYIFHFFVMIFLLIVTFYSFKSYKKSKASKFLVLSYGILVLSQIFFMFVNINHIIYVISEILQLIGYLSLLITFFMVLKSGKKKK